MNFTLPTTKVQMYETLQNIFHHYRIAREEYSGVTLTPLTLNRLNFTPLTVNQITQKAQTLVSASQEKKILEYTNDINERIASLTAEIAELNTNATTEIAEINTLYANSENTVELEAVKKGFGNSSVVLDKITALESEKNSKIAEVTSKKNAKVAEKQGEISQLNTKLSNVNTYFSALFTSELNQKISELSDAQEATIREVFKYNNGLDEKEKRAANSLIESNASLQLRFMEIKSNSFSTEQLIDMGYYEDVIRCVCGYYDTLSANSAYSSLLTETKLAIYLESFYQNIVYLYKTRANA